LRALGVELVQPSSQDGRPGVVALLDELGRRRMTNILVEGGAAVLGAFLDAQAIDEVHVFMAPRLAGGAEAKTPLGGRGVDRIVDALGLAEWTMEVVEGDCYIHGRVRSEPEI